jgi:hypothetical protein
MITSQAQMDLIDLDAIENVFDRNIDDLLGCLGGYSSILTLVFLTHSVVYFFLRFFIYYLYI